MSSNRRPWRDIKAEIKASYTHEMPPYFSDCEHEGNKELRLATIANGGKQLRYQCLDCGELIGSAVKMLGVDLSTISPVDEFLRKRTEQQRTARSTANAKLDAVLQEAWSKYYNAYLQTPEWKAKRETVLRRGNGVCEGCGRTMAEHVHHRTYENLGDEFLFELVALCRNCHQKIHPHREIA